MVQKMADSKTWSGLKNALNKTMHCIKDACWGAGRADTTPDARTSDAQAPPNPLGVISASACGNVSLYPQ